MFLPLIASSVLNSAASIHAQAEQVGWELEGTAHVRGVNQHFKFLSDGNLRFKNSVLGNLPDISGFDGTTCWTLGTAGFPHPVVQEDRDVDRITAWVLDGDLSKASVVKLAPIDKNTISIAVTDGLLTGKLALDPETHQPHTLSYWSPSGDEVWTFTNYKHFGDRTFATHIAHAIGADEEWYEVKSAKTRKVSDEDFKQPAPNLADTTFDSSAPNSVEVKTIGGYAFVHPLVNGKDVGWFFVDTGAEAMCIDPAVAKKLDLTSVGSTITAGVVATLETPIVRANEFKLGPVTISGTTFLELDLGQFARMFRLNIVGICGFDFLSRVSIALDTKSPSLSIYKPGDVPLPTGTNWTHFDFAGDLMCLNCKFEGDHEGSFTLDTGSNSTVDFMAPAVDKYDLLKGKKSSTVNVGGAGGVGKGKVAKLAWFDIGGNHLTNLIAGFQETATGAFASPYFAGNIGSGILGRFKLLLDYQNQRVAFVPVASK